MYKPGNDVEFSFQDTGADVTAWNVHVADDRPMTGAHVITLNGYQVVCSVIAATYEDRVCYNCNAGACNSQNTASQTSAFLTKFNLQKFTFGY